MCVLVLLVALHRMRSGQRIYGRNKLLCGHHVFIRWWCNFEPCMINKLSSIQNTEDKHRTSLQCVMLASQ